ncbi:hypothetical protein IPM62_00425 [Candidatus Woesebacteria bacterium]|nr:MAG: hypothetical protein IPM62_00425 [Candidatus Woesebacteria bacterium]
MKSKIIILIGYLVLFLIIFHKSYILLDPDFGYRLVTGQKILAGNIPKIDIYSYTMPSFPYVEHSFLIAAFWAFVYKYVGYAGLAFANSIIALSALIVATTVYSAGKPKTYHFLNKPFGRDWSLLGQFTFILAFCLMLPFIGIRAQIVSWLIISIFLKFLLTPKLWEKYKLLTPLFFLFWANTHGSFMAGLSMLFLVTVVRIYKLLFNTTNIFLEIKTHGVKVFSKTLATLSKTKAGKIITLELSIVVLSGVITLLNPYRFGLWREVWLSVSDSSLRWKILEWMPPFLSVDLGFVSFFSISLFFVFRYRKKFPVENFVLYVFVLSQALVTKRHVPLWMLVALPMTTQAITFLYTDVSNITLGKERFRTFYKIMWMIAIIIFSVSIYSSFKGAQYMAVDKFYPVGAVNYLNEYTPNGQIYSLYGWGGYLIWQLPEKKVFVDGRMPSWRWKNAPDNESNNAFSEYDDILRGKLDLSWAVDRYGIDTVLISPKKEKLNSYEEIKKKLNSFLLGDKDNNFNFYEALEKNGFEIVYKDTNSVIYHRHPI